MKQLFLKLLRLILVIYVFFFAFEWWKPIPEEMLIPSRIFMVPEQGVRFYSDILINDKNGKIIEDFLIEKRVQELVDGASHMVIVMSQLIPSTGSSSLSKMLTLKRDASKHVATALITDSLSTRYGGINSEPLNILTANGVLVIETDMGSMPDSNLFYSSLWRPFFSWWGNSSQKPWLVDPINQEGVLVTFRSWLAFLNIKSNESHGIVADVYEGKGAEKKMKIRSIITSSDFSDSLGSTGRVALEVDDYLWSSIIMRQATVAKMSQSGLPSFSGEAVSDSVGKLKVSLINVGLLRKNIVEKIDSMRKGDTLDISTTYLSDRVVISKLKDASNRNVTIRIILDPNVEVFGHSLYGMPNRPVARELISGTSNGISIRWCGSQALPCSSRILIGKTASTSFLIIGSADLSRRDIGGYNIESEIIVESTQDFKAFIDARNYFDKIWKNDGGNYTIDYSMFSDESFWRGSIYRIMEKMGITLY